MRSFLFCHCCWYRSNGNCLVLDTRFNLDTWTWPCRLFWVDSSYGDLRTQANTTRTSDDEAPSDPSMTLVHPPIVGRRSHQPGRCRSVNMSFLLASVPLKLASILCTCGGCNSETRSHQGYRQRVQTERPSTGSPATGLRPYANILYMETS